MRFKVGDLVWIRLRTKCFPLRALKPKADGPFHIVKKNNDNACQINLPGASHISATLNVVALTTYFGQEVLPTWAGWLFFQL